MSENHRGPEVPGEGVPVVERLDGLARITLEEIAITHFVKDGTLQNAFSTRPRVIAGLWKSALYAHRQVDEQHCKRSKKNGDKSAVAILKINDLHESVWKLVTCHELKQGPVGRRSSNARRLGCDSHDMKPPMSILPLTPFLLMKSL